MPLECCVTFIPVVFQGFWNTTGMLCYVHLMLGYYIVELKGYSEKYNLIQNSQAVKNMCAALRKAMVKKDVKSKVAAKKWL